MKGYFRGLAKQSGLTFAGGNPTVRAAPAALPDSISVPPPFQMENVNLVDSTEPGEDVVGQRRTHRDTGESPAWRGERAPLESSVGMGPWVRRSDQATSRTNSLSSGLVSRAELVETRFASERSVRAPAPSQSSGRHPDIEILEEKSSGNPGVVRVGEGQDFVQESRHKDDLSNLAGAMAREENAIPSEYLQGIRDWLSSESTRAEELESRFIAERDGEAPHRSFPSLVESDQRPQNEVQEFSLSIGSISVVVEEPEQPIRPKENNTQEAGNQSVSSQSRTRDAFALTRSYFRGF